MWNYTEIRIVFFSLASNLSAEKLPDTDTTIRKRCRQLERQNQRLREIIRSNLANEMTPKDFSHLSYQQIVEFLNQKQKNKEKEKEGTVRILNNFVKTIEIKFTFYNCHICADGYQRIGTTSLQRPLFWGTVAI
jgi:hypothetical protein